MGLIAGTPSSPKSHIYCLLSASLEQFLRAIWGAVSWAIVLILPQIKLNLKLSHYALFFFKSTSPSSPPSVKEKEDRDWINNQSCLQNQDFLKFFIHGGSECFCVEEHMEVQGGQWSWRGATGALSPSPRLKFVCAPVLHPSTCVLHHLLHQKQGDVSRVFPWVLWGVIPNYGAQEGVHGPLICS